VPDSSAHAERTADVLLPGQKAARPRHTRRQLIRWALLGLGPLVVLLISGWFYLTGGRYAATDDAFVKTHLVSISAQVPGQVSAVLVTNNQRVSAGQRLFEIDPASYQIALARAEADLANTRAQIGALRASYREKNAALQEAEATIRFQEREYERQSTLLKRDFASPQKVDQVRHAVELAKQQAEAVRQQIAGLQAQLGGDPNTPTEALPQYRAAVARRDDADLALARTKIDAPADGTVANVTLRPGNYVSAGMPIFSLAELHHLWVEANFKETDLTQVIEGQDATITVDAYPGVTWKGTVESLSPASGNEFSVLPAQNSSGNWVKIVQRIPVRVTFENQPGQPQLRAGMSVYAEIDTGAHRPALLTSIARALHLE
jgi:membrane fusion protein (multidrug efflux system)